ncbi:hypothetical protein ASZ90_009458 [hydrocarbon metagenome]|uniref:Uncharacterized protein n=1 Tax=hydrocarbon metagenome TaxID=938273 RepID=A0A0W8FKG4_9ZZZZ
MNRHEPSKATGNRHTERRWVTLLAAHVHIKPRMKPPMGATGATDENP